MLFNIITIFPRIFDSYLNESILKRAQKKGKIKINIHDLRDYATDKHHTVDDRPYGGGPGMLLKIEPVYKCLKKLDPKNPKISQLNANKKSKRDSNVTMKQCNNLIILFSPSGKKFDQKKARELTKYKNIIMICPRYEGYDARIEKLVDEKISIGDYVLTGGELPAMILVDTITRLLPGVIKKESLSEETHSSLKISAKSGSASGGKNYKLKINSEYPQYTRPEKFLNLKVPKILLSGNHKQIQEWREKHSKIRKPPNSTTLSNF